MGGDHRSPRLPCDNRMRRLTLTMAVGLSWSQTKTVWPFIFRLMSHIYVQTFYGASNGWRNVGGRRTAKDAARFCALLGRIRNDRLNKVAEVPVTFVLGE